MKHQIVLASKSPRRQELIRTLGFEAEIIPSQVDESVEEGMSPHEIVEELANRKAAHVDAPNRIVIGSDTVVVLGGEVLGKPRDQEEAYEMLSKLQGRTHEVYTGAACIKKLAHETSIVEQQAVVKQFGGIGRYVIASSFTDGGPHTIVGHTRSKVTFRPMSEKEKVAYIKTGDPMDKAGAYGIQGIGSVFVDRIDGDFYSIMGLPLNLLYQMLLTFGVNPLWE